MAAGLHELIVDAVLRPVRPGPTVARFVLEGVGTPAPGCYALSYWRTSAIPPFRHSADVSPQLVRNSPAPSFRQQTPPYAEENRQTRRSRAASLSLSASACPRAWFGGLAGAAKETAAVSEGV